MALKLSKTDEENKLCIAYLMTKGLNPITDMFVYSESDGMVNGVAGLMIGIGNKYKVGFIEPCIADNNTVMYRLGLFAEGALAMAGSNMLVVGCEQNEVIENMYKKVEYKSLVKNLNQYYKEI